MADAVFNIVERKLQQKGKIFSDKSGMTKICHSDPMRTMYVNESASGAHDNKFLIRT